MTILRRHLRNPLFTVLVSVLMLHTAVSYAACDMGNAEFAAEATMPCHGASDTASEQDIETCCAACFSAAPIADALAIAQHAPQWIANPRLAGHATLTPTGLFRPPISYLS